LIDCRKLNWSRFSDELTGILNVSQPVNSGDRYSAEKKPVMERKTEPRAWQAIGIDIDADVSDLLYVFLDLDIYDGCDMKTC